MIQHMIVRRLPKRGMQLNRAMAEGTGVPLSRLLLGSLVVLLLSQAKGREPDCPDRISGYI